MANDLTESKILIGKTKSDVRILLGDENYNSDSNNIWFFEIGHRPRLFNIDPDNLHIEFIDGKVSKVTWRKK